MNLAKLGVVFGKTTDKEAEAVAVFALGGVVLIEAGFVFLPLREVVGERFFVEGGRWRRRRRGINNENDEG